MVRSQQTRRLADGTLVFVTAFFDPREDAWLVQLILADTTRWVTVKELESADLIDDPYPS